MLYRKFFWLIACLIESAFLLSQTAVNFNANDCNSNNHILFNELDAGKVVIITWVMPCSSCIGPALSAVNEVQNLKNGNPGKFFHYIADDYANTNCVSLTSWCNANSITYDAIFSNADIKMLDYGSNGMPKTVVLAGTTHSVFFNENNSLNAQNFVSALNSALAISNQVGIVEFSNYIHNISFFPNPTKDEIEISNCKNEVISVYDITGNLLLSEKIDSDKHRISLKLLDAGMYLIRNNSGNTGKLIIEK